jgi:hypothetical protein
MQAFCCCWEGKLRREKGKALAFALQEAKSAAVQPTKNSEKHKEQGAIKWRRNKQLHK